MPTFEKYPTCCIIIATLCVYKSAVVVQSTCQASSSQHGMFVIYYFFNIPTHAPTVYTSKSTKFTLTLTLLTWRIGRAPNNGSRWQMGFNSAFKGLKHLKHLKLAPTCFGPYFKSIFRRLVEPPEDIEIDIFINCNWVVTRWQYTFTHEHYIGQRK
jgi:hypothetical protein